MKYLFKIEFINGNSFVICLNSLKQFVPLRAVNEVFCTSNMISVNLCNSAQVGHWHRKFHNRKQRNSKIKSCIKIPLLEKEQSYTYDCAKQKSKSLKFNKYLNLLTITLHLSLYAKPAPLLLF